MSTATQAKRNTTTVNELSDLDKVIAETLTQADRINAIVDKFEHFGAEDEARKALLTAIAINCLRETLDPMADVFLPLMNSRLGFKTDRPSKNSPKPYEWPVVRDCMIECLLNGGRITGNEMNIIAGNCYFTKEFFERKIKEFPGISDVQFLPGVPEPAGPNRVLVSYMISYQLDGKQQERLFAKSAKLDSRIPIKVSSSYDSDDMWIGKATRKAGARVYAVLTGKNVPEGEADNTFGEQAQRTQARDLDALRATLTAKPDSTTEPEEEQPADETGEEATDEQKAGIKALVFDTAMSKDETDKFFAKYPPENQWTQSVVRDIANALTAMI